MAVKARAKAKEAPPQRIEIPVDKGEAATRDALADQVPGWDKLSKDEREELTRLAKEHVNGSKPTKVKLNPKPGGGNSIAIEGDCETLGVLRLQKLFGASSMDPVNARASELLTYLGSVSADSTDRYNAALSFVESMAPQDQAEALLLVQMYCTHDAAIRALSQLGQSQWVPNTQMFGNLAAKLLRVSQGQMETLARMRRGGEQVVKHIHVDNRGGQAVIAETVNTGGAENGKVADQSHEPGIEATVGPALLGQDATGFGMPMPSFERKEAVPVARRASGGTEG